MMQVNWQKRAKIVLKTAWVLNLSPLLQHGCFTPKNFRKKSKQLIENKKNKIGLRLTTKLLWLALLQPVIAHANSTNQQEQVFRYTNANGVVVFSDKKPLNRPYERLLFDCYACNPNSTVDWQHTPLFKQQYQQEIQQAAKLTQLEPALIRAVIHAESAFNTAARSKSGAVGLMQLMPRTAQEVGVSNRYNAADNIAGGSRYLAKLLERFNGDIALACAAYNAGPTLVEQLGTIPNYPETQSYVKRVQILLQRYRKL